MFKYKNREIWFRKAVNILVLLTLKLKVKISPKNKLISSHFSGQIYISALVLYSIPLIQNFGYFTSGPLAAFSVILCCFHYLFSSFPIPFRLVEFWFAFMPFRCCPLEPLFWFIFIFMASPDAAGVPS